MKIFSKILLALCVLATAGCSEKTKTEEVEGSTEIVTVEVEKSSTINLNLSAFGYELQDDYPIILHDNEKPDTYFVDKVSIKITSIDDMKLGKVMEYDNLNLDENQVSIEIYKEGKYILEVKADTTATNVEDFDRRVVYYKNIVDINDNLHLNVNLLPYVNKKDLVRLKWKGEHTANILDYMRSAEEPCYISTNVNFDDLYFPGNKYYSRFSILCREDSVLDTAVFNVDSNNVVIFHNNDNINNLSIELDEGVNYISYTIETSDDLVYIDIPELRYTTQGVEHILENKNSYVAKRIDYAEFVVSEEVNEISIAAKFGNISVTELCFDADEEISEFLFNGELVQVEEYNDLHHACVTPTGHEGSNVYLDIFPITELTHLRDWKFKSDIPGFKLMSARGKNSFIVDGVEEKEIIWNRD